MKDSTARRLSRLHSLLLRATRGKVGRHLVGNEMLLLTTTGRKTGRPHTNPLLYLRDGDRLVVFASWGGRPYHPDWYLNLEAQPRASVRVGGRSFEVTARTADAQERAEWWPRAVAANPGYAGYQRKTRRQIPVVFLERAPGERTAENR